MAAKKAPAKKPVSKSASQTASTRRSSAAKPKVVSAKTKRARQVANAIANPARYAASSKVKAVPYSKMPKRGKQSVVSKVAQGAAEFYGPLAIVEGLAQAVTGVDFDKPLYNKSGKYMPPSRRKGSRLAGLAEAALFAAPLGKTAKKVKKAYRTGKSLNEVTKRSNTGTKATTYKTRQIG